MVKSIVHCRGNPTGDSTHGSSEVTRFGGTSEWLVALVAVDGVLPLPTGATEVLEALEVAAEVRPDHTVTHGTEGVLQVGVYLYLEGGGGRGCVD